MEFFIDRRAALAHDRPSMQVPLLDLKLQYQTLKTEIRAEIESITDSQMFICGPKVDAFEDAICKYTGAAHAIGVTSGVVFGFVFVRAIGKYVAEVQPPGALSIVASALVILLAAVVASAVPAARAARVNAVEALRAE